MFCFFFTREQMVVDSVLALDFLLKLRLIDGMKPGGFYNLSLSAYSQAKPASIFVFQCRSGRYFGKTLLILQFASCEGHNPWSVFYRLKTCQRRDYLWFFVLLFFIRELKTTSRILNMNRGYKLCSCALYDNLPHETYLRRYVLTSKRKRVTKYLGGIKLSRSKFRFFFLCKTKGRH